jgi:ammonia channel protein AmtB
LNDTEEKWYVVASQVFIPFMIAGFGMVAAGLVLERVKVFFLINSFDLINYSIFRK